MHPVIGEMVCLIFLGVLFFFSDDYRCFNGFEFVLEGGVTGAQVWLLSQRYY